MDGPSEHLRTLARAIVDAALERVPLRAALLVGSAGRGDADVYSDLDLLLYVDTLPPEEAHTEIREAVGGTNPIGRGEPTEHFRGEEFDLDGVRTEVTFATVGRVEWRLDQMLEQLEEIVDTPLQNVMVGILEGLPLHGDELIGRWQSRLRDYPEQLRRAMIAGHWDFFPLWYYREVLALRDAELFRQEKLVEASFHLLGVLAGLNHVYFARFHLKRTRALVAQMELAPRDLADRLESLFRLEPLQAAKELARLIEETRALVVAELPDVQLPLRYPLEARQQPCSL